MPQIIAPFELNSKQPNFTRDQYKSLEDMRNVDPLDIDEGHTSYCITTKKHYIFSSENSFDPETGYWRERAQDVIHIGEDEPENHSVLWVDTSNSVDDPYEEIDHLKSKINVLERKVETLIKLINYGIMPGDSTVGGRTQISGMAIPIEPGSDQPEEPEEPPKIQFTVPNNSVKIDTSTNFKKNRRNLIEGEPCWMTDLGGLYIYVGGVFHGCGGGGSQPTKDVTIEIENNNLDINDDNETYVWIDNNNYLNINEVGEIVDRMLVLQAD